MQTNLKAVWDSFSGGPTQLVEVRLHPVAPGYRAHQPRLQEGGPLVDQRPLTSVVVLQVKTRGQG